MSGLAPFRWAWRGIRRLWAHYQWPILGLGAVVATILGYVGYSDYYQDLQQARSPIDIFYLDLQLFTFSTVVEEAGFPWQLQVARFLAPIVAGYSALRGLSRIFRDRVDQVRWRFWRGHSIVVGAGETGLAFVRTQTAAQHKVVVVESDAANVNLEACRELGAGVLLVDARQPESLVLAGVAGAAHLITVTGDDGMNAEIVLNAQQLVRQKRRTTKPLRCIAHVVDADLWHLLRVNELRDDDEVPVRLDFFNMYEQGARLLVDTHPPTRTDGVPRALVVGDGVLAERVVVYLARRWDARQADADLLPVTLLGPRATALRDLLIAEAGQLARVCTIESVDARLDRLALPPEVTSQGTVDIAYVCPESDSAAVVVAQLLIRGLPEAKVVVCLSHSIGLIRVLEDEHLAGGPGLRRLQVFPLLDRTCHPESLLTGVHESLAEAIHDRYRQKRLDEDEGVDPSDPALAPWALLGDELKASNRSQARDIREKLRVVGCDLAPESGWQQLGFTFTAEEVERLARREHDRWMAERLDKGWVHGEATDRASKVSALLVPWDQLDPGDKETNRELIHAIPELAALAGFQVIRLFDASAAPSWVEPLARAIHEHYREQRQRDGAPPPPSWDELDEILRNSNRAQASAIPSKLAKVGCRIAPAGSVGEFAGFTPAELELLARDEHERWVDERLAAGWTKGPKAARRSPDLVPWPDLPEDRRELDREAIRAIPTVLALAGTAIRRGAERGDDPPG